MGAMVAVGEIAEFLREFAPLELAESWDNVGLLLGRTEAPVRELMTCLTVTPDTVREAVEQRAGLIVTHHPFPFRPLKQITSETIVGRLLLELAEARVAVYSPHTAFDSAREGINQALAEQVGLQNIRPLGAVHSEELPLGSGRCGDLPSGMTLGDLATRLKESLRLPYAQIVGSLDAPVTRLGIACGSGGELLTLAREARCDVFLTGEASFHRCLEAEADGIAMVLIGHYASERFAVERLAERLAARFPQLRVWASERERDPLTWL